MATLRRAELDSGREQGYFLKYAYNATSQCGEDGILRELFRLLGVGIAPVCVDIGAWDGKHLSNTHSLLHAAEGARWGGVLVEANEMRCREMETLYEHRTDVLCLNTLVSFEGHSSLDGILDRANVRADFELLCIDIDGNDYHLWESVQLFTPRVVVIEFNPTIPNHIVFIQAKNMDVHHGSSLAALVELGARKDYELVAATMYNAIFVHKAEMHKLPQYDRSVHALHVPTMTTDMFQLYDGTLIFHGCKKLLWHRLPIDPNKLQVLAKRDRGFPFAPPRDSQMNALQVTCDSALAFLLEGSLCSERVHTLRDTLTTIATYLDQPAMEAMAAEMLMDVATLIRTNHSHCSEAMQLVHQLIQLLIERGDRLTHAGTAPWIARKSYQTALYLCEGDEAFAKETADIQAKLAGTYTREQRLPAARYWLTQAKKTCQGNISNTIAKEQKRYFACSSSRVRAATKPDIIHQAYISELQHVDQRFAVSFANKTSHSSTFHKLIVYNALLIAAGLIAQQLRT